MPCTRPLISKKCEVTQPKGGKTLFGKNLLNILNIDFIKEELHMRNVNKTITEIRTKLFTSHLF